MQLMTLNSLLMFDIVFIFFLFLVGVTCLVYYLPPPALGFRKGNATAACNAASAGPTNYSCGTTTTCTGETVRFRRYSVGSLLSANELTVGNHRYHNPVLAGTVTTTGVADADLLVTDCELEEILSLRGGGESPILVAPPGYCACCAEQQHLEQHLVENPLLLAAEAAAASVTPPCGTPAIAGVDYVQIEIERTAVDPVPPCCYVRAKDADIKECHGPIHDV